MQGARLVLVLLAIAVAVALAWHWLGGNETPAPSPQTTDGDGKPELLEGRGPALETGERPETRPAPGAQPDGSFVVRGSAYYGWKKPAAGQVVEAKAYEGYDAKGTLALEATLTADEDGRIAWSIARPTKPMYLTFAAKGTNAKDSCRALPDAPAPTSVSLYIYSNDATVKGRVTDMDGRPIDGAIVIPGFRRPLVFL